MNSKAQVAQLYIDYLSQGNTEGIIALFNKEGLVDSPLYGKQKAGDFYEKLAADTRESQLEIKGIFEEKDQARLALYFTFHWKMIHQKEVFFEVVDILSFDQENKIKNLKIIYDTVQARAILEALKNN